MKPTLGEQIAISKLSDEELVDLFLPHGCWQHINFWTFEHLPLLHQLFWKTVCWFYPYSVETHTRYWRWNKGDK